MVRFHGPPTTSTFRTKYLWLAVLLGCSRSVELEPPPDAAAVIERSVDRFEITIQTAHAKGIQRIAFSADGRLLITASDDQTIRIWNVDGRLLRTIDSGVDHLIDADLSHDGSVIVVGMTGAIRRWSLDGNLLTTLTTPGLLSAVRFSPDASHFAVAGGKNVRLFDRSGSLRANVDVGAQVASIAFTRDGLLLAGTDDGRLTFWTQAGAPLRSIQIDKGAVSAIDVAKDGRIVTGGQKILDFDDSAKLRSARGREEIVILRADGERLLTRKAETTFSVVFAPDGEHVLSGDAYGKMIRIWSTDGASARSILAGGPRKSPTHIAVSPDGQRIAAASADLPTLKIFAFDGRLLDDLARARPQGILSIDWSPTGDRLVTGDRAGFARVWSTNGRLLAEVKADGWLDAVAFAPDGSFATGGPRVRWFDPKGRLLRSAESHRHGTPGLTFSADGRLFAGDRGGNLTVYSSAGRILERRRVFDDRIDALAVTDDGRRVLASSWRELALIEEGRVRRAAHSSILYRFAFERAGFVTAGGGITFWSDELEVRRTIETPHRFVNVGALDVGEERILASVDRRLWILSKDGERLAEVNGPTEVITAARLSPDGRHAAVVSEDASTRIFRIDTGAQMILVASESEWVAYTPDGWFDASRRGGKLVAMVRGLDAFGVDQFAPRTNRPDRMLRELGLGTPELLDHFALLHQRRLEKMRIDPELSVSPPEARIISAKPGGRKLDLTLECSSESDRYQIWADGVPVAANSMGGSTRAAETIDLGQGDNLIEVSCTDRSGNESYRAAARAQWNGEVTPALFFLGFGVSRHSDARLDLEFADDDIVDLAEVMARMKGRGFGEVHTKILTNADCTRAAIEEARSFLARSTPDDTIVLAVSGHGVHARDGRYYFLTHESDVRRLSNTAAPFEAIESLLEGVPARRKLFLLDTCESGNARPAIDGLRARVLDAEVLDSVASPIHTFDRFIDNDLVRRTGAIVFSSSGGGEVSFEGSRQANGLFTEEVLRALTTRIADRDRNGRISIDELRDFVSQRVSEQTRGLQNPSVDRDNIHARFDLPL